MFDYFLQTKPIRIYIYDIYIGLFIIMNEEDLLMFQNPSFDLIEFINRKFPDENSLKNLDKEIENVEKTISVFQQEISQEI